MLTIICIAVGVVVLVFLLLFSLQGAQFVPTNDRAAAIMLEMVAAEPAKRIIDIGCGDGKLLVMLARQGYQADGVEINPWLVLRARRAIKKAGVTNKARVFWGNFWKFDMSNYDTVLVYAITHVMSRLEQKLRHELPAGARIISNSFKFPGLKPSKTVNNIRLYRLSTKEPTS